MQAHIALSPPVHHLPPSCQTAGPQTPPSIPRSRQRRPIVHVISPPRLQPLVLAQGHNPSRYRLLGCALMVSLELVGRF